MFRLRPVLRPVVTRTALTALRLCRTPPNRLLFNFARKPATQESSQPQTTELFHLLSQSPHKDLKIRAERVKRLASCPICLKIQGTKQRVAHECANCGWPTHCTHEHWEMDDEHRSFCGKLREVNEDEHDIRSGRALREFALPGPIGYDETVSFSNWDIFWYTRGFPSVDDDRAGRHLSKLLTYPLSVAGVIHEHSSLTTRNQRLTPEGLRSLVALRTSLHVPLGAPETHDAPLDRPPVRIFILGPRAESSLPNEIWNQLCLLFPSAYLQVIMIGPEASLPGISLPPEEQAKPPVDEEEELKTLTTWKPKIRETAMEAWTRNEVALYGVPSYTTPVNHQLTIVGVRSPYADVHERFGPFDPYSDVFFAFNPGFGFPSSHDAGIPQIASQAEWGSVIPLILETKCALFVTGFSAEDVERDVRSLEGVPGVSGEFDWVLTPGENPFASLKWDVAEFDPRLMVKTNWGIWGIRGKRREVDHVYTKETAPSV